MDKLTAMASIQSRLMAVATSLALVLIVGVVDYLSGYEISFSVFYLFAISFAIWNVGPVFAVFISALSVTSWLVGDWAAGVVYPNRFVPVWNATIILVFYLFVVWLFSRLKSLNQTLESRILQRTAALAAEIKERQRLEKEILTVSVSGMTCTTAFASILPEQRSRDRYSAKSWLRGRCLKLRMPTMSSILSNRASPWRAILRAVFSRSRLKPRD